MTILPIQPHGLHHESNENKTHIVEGTVVVISLAIGATDRSENLRTDWVATSSLMDDHMRNIGEAVGLRKTL